MLMETTKPEFIINCGRERAAKGPMKAVVVGGMHYIQMKTDRKRCTTS